MNDQTPHAPSFDPAADGPGDPAKRAYERPALETVGSVPRLTGGSDIFGDRADDDNS